MVDAERENQKEKEREPSEREARIRRWPIIPLVGGPIGILILLCYVTTAKPPAPVEPSKSAGVNEQVLVNEVEALKSQAEQLYNRADGEDDFNKRNKLLDEALELCWKAQAKFDRIREAYEEEEKKGDVKKGTMYQWEESNMELNELIVRIKFKRGF